MVKWCMWRYFNYYWKTLVAKDKEVWRKYFSSHVEENTTYYNIDIIGVIDK